METISDKELLKYAEFLCQIDKDSVQEMVVKELPEDVAPHAVCVRIPFPNLYDSCLTDLVDSCLEGRTELNPEDELDIEGFFAYYDDKYEEFTKTLSDKVRSDIVNERKKLYINYNVPLKIIVEGWLDMTQELLEKYLGHDLRMDILLKSFTSPKYYNFESDLLDVWMHEDDWKELCSKNDIFKDPEYVEWAKEATTSRDGYIAYYEFSDTQDYFMPTALSDNVTRKCLTEALRAEDFIHDEPIKMEDCECEMLYRGFYYGETIDIVFSLNHEDAFHLVNLRCSP